MSFWRKHYEKVNLIKNILLITLPIAAFVLLISLHGIRINEKHFPDRGLRGAIIGYVDKNKNGFLNKEELEEAKILPVLGNKNEIVSVNQKKCILVPEFIARLQSSDDITRYFSGTVIDMVGKSQYAPLLEAIGCVKADSDEILRVLANKTERFIQVGSRR